MPDTAAAHARERPQAQPPAGAAHGAVSPRWPHAGLTQDRHYNILSANGNFSELTGVEAVDLRGKPDAFWELVHELDAPRLREAFARAANGSAVVNSYRVRHARSGRIAYILEHRRAVGGPDGRVGQYEVEWIDLTRQTIAERRLAASAWKETLAILTLGMAHDFTNVIAGIHSLSESFLAQLEPSHPFHEGMELIKKSSLQASQQVQRMVSLHRSQPGERSLHDLNEVVREVLELVHKILPRRIVVASEIAAGQLPVTLDLVEFRQAVINLILNASDAMQQSGKLLVRTARHTEPPLLEHVKGTVPRPPCVCLTIADSGCGISPRHLGAIFDPFFTTKARGSGLGLYNARLAVEKIHGAISVASTVGRGTTFQIWLPLADLSERVPGRAEHTRRTSRRSLLLIGQSGELLDKTAELLRSHNCYVVIASASERLSDFLQSPDYAFDAVMLLAEPSDGGLFMLASEVRQQNKAVKLVLRLAPANPDEFDPKLLACPDLLLAAELSESEWLGRLHTFFDQNT